MRLQQSAAIKFGGHRDGVGRLAAPVEIQDRVIDVLVGGAVEVTGAQPLQHVGDGVFAEQHAAEHRLLGRHVLRGLAPEIFAGRRGIHAGLSTIINDGHVASAPPPTRHSNVHSIMYVSTVGPAPDNPPVDELPGGLRAIAPG